MSSGDGEQQLVKRPPGRPKGSKSKYSRTTFQGALRATGLDPELFIAQFAMDRIACEDCEDGRVPPARYMIMTGETKFDLIRALDAEYRKASKSARTDLEMPCPTCAGRHRVPLDPKERLKAAIHISRTRTPMLSSVTIEDEKAEGLRWMSLNHDADSDRASLMRKLAALYEARQALELGRSEQLEQGEIVAGGEPD